MTKAILEFEAPKMCKSCILHVDTDKGFSVCLPMGKELPRQVLIAGFCPLTFVNDTETRIPAEEAFQVRKRVEKYLKRSEAF